MESILPGHMGTRTELVKFAVKLWVSSPEQEERTNYIKEIPVKKGNTRNFRIKSEINCATK